MSRIASLFVLLILSCLATTAAAAECQEVAKVYRNEAGAITRIVLNCDACTETAKKCHRIRERNEHGDVRTYCACENDGVEPTRCHLVLLNPDGAHGLPPSLVCAGGCSAPATCPGNPVVSNQIPMPHGSVEDQKCPCR